MPLSPGYRLGVYEILAAIGAGGMGEVYRARDTKLGREVAIKTIPELFAAESERVARFEREAQLLAALNHPHIAAIYGLEDSPTGKFLVLELVDGESLADRLARDGALSVTEALRIANQIIDALEAAHDKGIIHRDLKPGNIMLTADGQVKVLDFGLARALETAPASVSNSPTLSLAATQAGVILGTAAYMSPEQAKGRVADKRSDVWAFGCVLYEMLTGRRAFEGEDVSDTLASILKGEPDWTVLPADVPENVRTIIRRCLARDRRGRIPDVSVVRYLLSEGPSSTAGEPVPQQARPGRARSVTIGIIGVTAGVALASAVWWGADRWNPPAPPQPMRFEFAPTAPLSINPTDRSIAIAPDGTRIAYASTTSGGDSHLSIRPIDQVAGATLPGTAGARFPFFSPDGRSIAYFAGGELRKIAVSGGPPMSVCRITGAPRGGTWTDKNEIVFATNNPTTGLMVVAASGGEPKVLTKPDTAGSSVDHWFPASLPGGRALIYTIAAPGLADSAQLAAIDLETGRQRTLLAGGSHAEYVSTGHLVYGYAGTLRAVRFDPERLEIVGEAAPVEQGVLTVSATGAANFAISRTGHLLFVPGSGAEVSTRTLVWVDRAGREEPIPAPPRAYTYARVSPDASRLAFSAGDQEQDVWVWDLRRKTSTRITFGPTLESNPVWMPDGLRLVFTSNRNGPPNLYVHSADGTGTTERLTTSPNLQGGASISRDATTLLLVEVVPATGADVHALRLDGKSKSQPIVQTAYADTNPHLSPDGRWFTYTSADSAQPNVYVKPFPDVDAGRWHISPAGGSRAVWSRDGRELFYMAMNGAIMAVPVETSGNAFRAGNPVKLFDSRYFAAVAGRPFDVAPDGRFVMIKEPNVDESADRGSLVFVSNWLEELKAKLPPK